MDASLITQPEGSRVIEYLTLGRTCSRLRLRLRLLEEKKGHRIKKVKVFLMVVNTERATQK